MTSIFAYPTLPEQRRPPKAGTSVRTNTEPHQRQAGKPDAGVLPLLTSTGHCKSDAWPASKQIMQTHKCAVLNGLFGIRNSSLLQRKADRRTAWGATLGLPNFNLPTPFCTMAAMLTAFLLVGCGHRNSNGKDRPDLELAEVQFRGSTAFTETRFENPVMVPRKHLATSVTSRNSTTIVLLIGINAPPPGSGLPRLQGAVDDMKALEHALVCAGVPQRNIELLLDKSATKEAIFGALDALEDLVRENDLIIVAYSGHGGLENSRSFLATYGQQTELREVLERLGRMPTRRRLLFVDACRSGQQMEVRFQFTPEALDRTGSLAWIASCSANQYSMESGGHGLFMSELAKAFENAEQLDSNGNGILDFQELAGWLEQQVSSRAEALGYMQTPYSAIVRWTGDQGILHIARKWSISLEGDANRQAVFRGTFDVNGLGPSETLWLVVEPGRTPGQFWPQPESTFKYKKGKWQGFATLGESQSRDESFRVCLVRANAGLTMQFRDFFRIRRPEFGIVLEDMPIVAEVEVQRK